MNDEYRPRMVRVSLGSAIILGLTRGIIDAKPSNLDELDVREAWDWIFSRTKYDDVDVGTKNQRKAFICENVELRPRNIARYIYMKAYEFKI